MPPMVDAERLATTWLRNAPGVQAIVGDRVYTEPPRNATFPLLRVQQIGGAPVMGHLLWLDQAILQLDAYGGPKAQAFALLDAARNSLMGLHGTHEAGVVTSVRFGFTRYLPDDSLTPPQPRWLSEIEIYSHP